MGGTLLVGPSHGDAAMASIDPRYRLSGVVTSRSVLYKVSTTGLETYLTSKKPIEVTHSVLHERGRGIAYTKSPFAYLFTKNEATRPYPPVLAGLVASSGDEAGHNVGGVPIEGTSRQNANQASPWLCTAGKWVWLACLVRANRRSVS